MMINNLKISNVKGHGVLIESNDKGWLLVNPNEWDLYLVDLEEAKHRAYYEVNNRKEEDDDILNMLMAINKNKVSKVRRRNVDVGCPVVVCKSIYARQDEYYSLIAYIDRKGALQLDLVKI